MRAVYIDGLALCKDRNMFLDIRTRDERQRIYYSICIVPDLTLREKNGCCKNYLHFGCTLLRLFQIYLFTVQTLEQMCCNMTVRLAGRLPSELFLISMAHNDVMIRNLNALSTSPVSSMMHRKRPVSPWPEKRRI